MSYSSKPLRPIDKTDAPEMPYDARAPGTCVCGCDRDSHYYGKTDYFEADFHACLVFRCDCKKYVKARPKDG